MCKWCVRKGDGEREAHWRYEVRPKIMFPSPQSYNTATMMLIYLLSLGNWIAVKLVGRAAAISNCGASKPTPGNAYYPFDMDVLAISDNVWCMDRYVKDSKPSIRGSYRPKDYKEIRRGHFACFRPVLHFASVKSSQLRKTPPKKNKNRESLPELLVAKQQSYKIKEKSKRWSQRWDQSRGIWF